eukprot:GSMAST32.ASY1.ANO1.1696.1 assembled CDS
MNIPIKKLKIVVVGESGVGKTSAVVRFVKQEFKEGSSATIGVAFLKTSISTVVNDKQIKVSAEIWDTAGQEVYRTILPLYYKSADCVLICYDITNRKSFDELKYWETQIQKECGNPNIIVGVIGTKLDLPENRKVSISEARKFTSKRFGDTSLFKETSALTGENISETFSELVGLSIRYGQLSSNKDAKKPLKLQNPSHNKKKKCC